VKKVLTGFSNNIKQNKEKIKVWAESFKKHSRGEVVLIAANTTQQDLETLENLGIHSYLVEEHDTYRINHKRLKHTENFLRSSDADIFLITDVFDVVFQADPFLKLNTQDYDLFLTAEGVLVSEEPWNADVIKKVFGDEINTCKHQEIFCSGVIGGKKDALIELYRNMFEKCENGTDDHNIKDQAALILMIANNQIDNFQTLTLNDAWAMHCATSGPTEFFEKWGMKNNIQTRYNVPIMLNNEVCTSDGRKFDIVHQFNRVPEWKQILTKDYE
jgi:hypothetical protein